MVSKHLAGCTVLVFVGLFGTGRSARAQVPITPENEPCMVLSDGEYTSLPPAHFLKIQFPTLALYRAHRASIEVVEYNGLASTTHPLFMSPRNVTDQDDVYLRLRGNTYQYSYTASFTASDLARGELLNVIGASPTKAIFDAQTASDATGDAAQNAAKAESAKPAVSGATKQTGLPDAATFSRLGLSQDEYQRTMNRIAQLRAELNNALNVAVGGLTLSEALIAFEARADELRLAIGVAIAQAMSNPAGDNDFSALDDALAAAETAARRLPELMATLRSGANPLLARLEGEIPELRSTVQRMQEQMRSARTRASSADVALFDRAEPSLQFAALLADVNDLDVAKNAIRDQIAALTSNIARATEALASARLEIVRFREAGRMRDVCTSVGRFRNKSVKVTVTARPVAQPTSTLPPAAPTAPSGAPAAAAAPTADTPITREVTFEADNPTHVHVKLGPMVSWLKNPEFRLDTITTGCPEGRQCFKPIVSEGSSVQVQAAVNVSLLLPARYFWADSDPNDPHEAVRQYRLVPYPTFGFSLTNADANVLLGGGVDLGRGVGILFGVHLGQVRRLRQEFRADPDDPFVGAQFDRPAGTTVAVDDVVDDESWVAAPYLSLSIDAATLGRIFTLGNNTSR